MKAESIETEDFKYSVQPPMKLEPVSPKEAGYSDEQPMKVEPNTYLKGLNILIVQQMEIDSLSPEGTDHADDHHVYKI